MQGKLRRYKPNVKLKALGEPERMRYLRWMQVQSEQLCGISRATSIASRTGERRCSVSRCSAPAGRRSSRSACPENKTTSACEVRALKDRPVNYCHTYSSSLTLSSSPESSTSCGTSSTRKSSSDSIGFAGPKFVLLNPIWRQGCCRNWIGAASQRRRQLANDEMLRRMSARPKSPLEP